MHVSEPKVRARNIIVRPAISSDVSNREHTPPASPEVSMLIPAWLWETIQQQENQESREKTREPATPPPCPEAWTVTPSPGPSTHNTHDAGSAQATDPTNDWHDTCRTRFTCDSCGRRDSSHTCDTSVTCDARDACNTISPIPAIPEVPASPVMPAAPVTPATPGIPASPMTP